MSNSINYSLRRLIPLVHAHNGLAPSIDCNEVQLDIDDRISVVGASSSGAVDSGLIPSRVKPTTLKLVFTASLLDAQHYRESVENKSASLPVPLGKALTGIPPSSSSRWQI